MIGFEIVAVVVAWLVIGVRDELRPGASPQDEPLDCPGWPGGETRSRETVRTQTLKATENPEQGFALVELKLKELDVTIAELEQKSHGLDEAAKYQCDVSLVSMLVKRAFINQKLEELRASCPTPGQETCLRVASLISDLERTAERAPNGRGPRGGIPPKGSER
jgi:hypothetical protein